MANPMKKLLDEEEVSTAQLLEDLDSSRTSIYEWVKGKHLPSRGNLNLILDYLGIEGTEKFEWQLEFKRERGRRNG